MQTPSTTTGNITTSATIASSIALRLRPLARHLFELGERPLYEFLAEIVGGADPMARLERYARLDPEIVDRLGGRDLPPAIRRIK